MKQTAVEWFAKELNNWRIKEFGEDAIIGIPTEVFEQAKAMEKQQIGKAFFEGRLKEIGSGVLFDMQPLSETFNNYYNETFKSE
jgi:hypothetical protein